MELVHLLTYQLFLLSGEFTYLGDAAYAAFYNGGPIFFTILCTATIRAVENRVSRGGVIRKLKAHL
jgi:hypothetical protein